MDALLDACSVSYFFQAGQKAFIERAAAVCRIHLMDSVLEELAKETSWGAGCVKLIRALEANAQAEVHSMLLGTEEAALFNRLRTIRPRKISTRDQGELASIALAVHRPELVLVTEDHGALRWALDEIPGFPCRVTRTAAWIRAVVGHGASLQGVSLPAWAAKAPPPLPVWWAEWLAADRS